MSKSTLPSTKEVLCEHVYAVVKSMTPKYANVVTGMLSELTEKELFHKVSEIETELCAQVTGMLLEMDRQMLIILLNNPAKLETAVNQSKLEYLREHHPATLPTREDLGEELYEVISRRHPDHAQRITGMLLDLDVSIIQELLDSPTQLDKHIAQAFHVVNKKS